MTDEQFLEVLSQLLGGVSIPCFMKDDRVTVDREKTLALPCYSGVLKAAERLMIG